MKTALFLLALLGHDLVKYLTHTVQRARWRARGVRLSAKATVTVQAGTRIDLARDVSLGLGTVVVVANDPLADAPRASALSIGRGTAVNEYCNLRAAGGTIRIGERCLFGQFVSLVASNHGLATGTPMALQPWDPVKTDIEIADDVWLGAHCVVLPGVRIGTGAVVAAGAVVAKDVPPGEIWGGVPARRISQRVDTATSVAGGGR